jgi:hypothetical protein
VTRIMNRSSPREAANGAGEIARVVEKVQSLDDVFVRRCVDVIVQLCRLYGFDDTGYSLKRTYDHWIGCAAASGVHPMKFVKWKLSAFYAYHKSFLVIAQDATATPLELPDALPGVTDNPSCLLTGRGYRWINYLRLNSPHMFDSFITSVLRAKTGMPRPNKQMLRAEEVKTFKDLTKGEAKQTGLFVPFTHQGITSNFNILPATFIRELRRTVHEVFSGQTYTQDDRIRPFVPSASANYINGRNDLGAIGTIVHDVELMRGLKTDWDQDLIDIVMKKDVRKGNVSIHVNDYRLKERFHRLYNRIVSRAYHELPVAVPLALPEALKVRVITKGPPFLYTALKPLQRKLWSVLSSHPTFVLTGTPVTTEIVNRQVGKLGREHGFLSADYKNATNEMMSWASEAVVNALSDELLLPHEERELFMKAMTRHVIEDKETKEQQPQRHGQLMGSVVSFIVLCLVNATICRLTQELAGGLPFGSLTLRQCHMLINGDDAVFKTTPQGVVIWRRLASFVGMEPSVGKVYYSKHFLNINSTTYNYHKDGIYSVLGTRELVRFELVQNVNLGLMFGLKRSGGKTEAVDEGRSSLGARARALIHDAPPELGEALLKQYLKYNDAALKVVNLPWFLPESLGGLGLPNVGRYVASDLTLRLARKIFDHPDLFAMPSKPLDTPWKLWKYAVQKTRMISERSLALASVSVDSVNDTPNTTMATLMSVRNLFCVQAILTGELSTLYNSPAQDPKVRASAEKKSRSMELAFLRQKSLVWKKALLDQTIKLPEPFNVRNFPSPVASLDSQRVVHLYTA